MEMHHEFLFGFAGGTAALPSPAPPRLFEGSAIVAIKKMNTLPDPAVLPCERTVMEDGFVIAGELPAGDWPDTLGGKGRQAAAHEERFGALVERQSRFAYRVAYALLRNPQDAQDAVQETFLKLYRTGAWQRMQNEKAFLARATWRVAVDRLPRTRNQEPNGTLASGDASPETAAIAVDWVAAIQKLIDGLPEELRQPLVLSAVEGLNSREIAPLM